MTGTGNMRKRWCGSVWCAVLTGICVLLQCGRALSPEQYVATFNDNARRWAVTVERNGFRMVISHRPREYFIAREITFDKTLSREQVAEKYAGSRYFTVAIEPVKSDDAADKTADVLPLPKKEIMERIYDGKGEALIAHGKDTIPAVRCAFERDWRNRTVGTYNVVFRDVENFRKYSLILRDFKLELGTVVVPAGTLIKKRISLRG